MLIIYQQTHRHIDESRSRVTKKLKIQEHKMEMIQTAISSLGEDCKSESYMQTAISRVKAMGSNDGRYNTQSPLEKGAGKSSNLTGWSTNGYSLPDLQLNIPTQHQQCKGLPDFRIPPPVVQPHPVVQ